MSLLGKLTKEIKESTTKFILKCQNFDGGFGVVERAESHAGQNFCCTAALAICDSLNQINSDKLCWWLSERQCKNGGLNGRPEKLADVCYSWWVLSSLSCFDKLDWINKSKLQQFIYNCQDLENGGISDKPNNMVDVFHTYFGIGGLSLLRCEEGLQTIDPIYALPVLTLKKLNIDTPYTRRFKL